MKKVLFITLFVMIVFVSVSCTTTSDVQESGSYVLTLPVKYEYHSAESMNAEAGCIGVFVDPDRNLPELWVYSFAADGRSLETFAKEKCAEFGVEKKILFHDHVIKGQLSECAVIEFNENWYDTKYYNYYHIVRMSDGTFMCLDFACNPDGNPADNMRAVEKVLEKIGR